VGLIKRPHQKDQKDVERENRRTLATRGH
jgi:hypothetical protein